MTGHDAASGDRLELEFQPPRRLTGLQAFFTTHGLRSNDRIVLVFEDDGLHVEAVRRERGSAGKQGSRSQAHGASPTHGSGFGGGPRGLGLGGSHGGLGDGGDPHGSSRVGDTENGAEDRARGAAARDDGAARAGESGAGPDARDSGRATDPTRERRRVVRERIRGNAPPMARGPAFDVGNSAAGSASGSTAANGRSDRSHAASNADAKDGAAMALPRWEPLDVMAPPGGWTEEIEGDLREAARIHGHTIVREVRRSRLGVGRQPTAPAEAGQVDAQSASGSETR